MWLSDHKRGKIGGVAERQEELYAEMRLSKKMTAE